MAGPLTVGVDIGGSKIAAAVVDEDGTLMARADRSTPERTVVAEVVAAEIADAVAELRASYDIAAVGVGAAGFVDADRHRVMFAPHLSWRAEPLGDRLADALGLPVLIDNDANAALWAEHRFGSARNARDVVLVTLGTGIGGALLVDGRVYRGHGGMAGEFGHSQFLIGSDDFVEFADYLLHALKIALVQADFGEECTGFQVAPATPRKFNIFARVLPLAIAGI